MSAVIGAQSVAAEHSAFGAYGVLHPEWGVRLGAVEIVPEDYDLLYVACVAPREHTGYVAVAFVERARYQAMHLLGVAEALFVQDALQMAAGILHSGLDYYRRVVYPAQRLNSLDAVLTLYGIGFGYGPKKYGLVWQPLLLGE